MDDGAWLDWEIRTKVLNDQVHFGPPSKRWLRLLKDLRRKLPANFERWNDGTTAALSDLADLSDTTDTKAVRCIRMAYSEMTGDSSILSPTDAKRLKHSTLPKRKEGSVQDMGKGRYAVPVKAACKIAKGNGTVVRSMDALVTVQEIDPEAVETVGYLPFEYRQETVSIRMHEGRFLRPVYAPGTSGRLVQASLEAFARGCTGQDAWLDNPFMAVRTPLGLAVDDVAASPTDRREADRVWAASNRMVKDVGTLYLIDGVVHRTIDEPKLHVVIHRKLLPSGMGTNQHKDGPKAPIVTLSWSCTGLESNLPDDNFRLTAPYEPTWGFNFEAWRTKIDVIVPGITFPVSMHRVAEATAAALSAIGQIRLAPTKVKPFAVEHAEATRGWLERVRVFGAIPDDGERGHRNGHHISWAASNVIEPALTAETEAGDKAEGIRSALRRCEKEMPKPLPWWWMSLPTKALYAVATAAADAFDGRLDHEEHHLESPSEDGEDLAAFMSM